MHALNVNTFQPRLNEVHQYQRFAGRYYLTGVITKAGPDGLPFMRLTLSDATDELHVFTQNPNWLNKTIKPNSLVHIEAALTQQSAKAFFKIKQLSDGSECASLGNDLYALPRALCPNLDAFNGFFIMTSRIKHPLLSAFLTEVLLQPHIGVRYLQCPASLKHHHNYPGGLLRHSVEVAWALYNIQAFSPLDQDIAVVAALLHDIGKVLTLTPDVTRSSLGKWVDHDQLTLEICAPALAVLSSSSPQLAEQLRHIWTCYSPNARFGFTPKTEVAFALQRADRSSAKREGNISHIYVEYARLN